jgi:nucleoside-diphosphate-sugar epimerase
MTHELHVIFGAGPVGRSIMAELVARGKTVRLVNRSGAQELPHGVESRTGDVTNHEFTRQAAAGASHVYFALNPAYTQWVTDFPPLQKSVLEAAAAAKAKLIVMENLYGYGIAPMPLTEDLPLSATYDKGSTRAEMTRELLAAHGSGKVRVTMGRAADFFGPHVTDSSGGEVMFGAAVQGKTIQVLGDPTLPHTYTYMPDIGKALVILGERDEAFGQAWHIPSPRTVTTHEFIKLILKETQTQVGVQAAGKWLTLALGLFMPMMREFRKTMYQFDRPFSMDHSKFARAFGDISTPLETAIPATVRWYREVWLPKVSAK